MIDPELVEQILKDADDVLTGKHKPTWIICGTCGQDTKTTWEKACNEGCPGCLSMNTEVYGSNPNE